MNSQTIIPFRKVLIARVRAIGCAACPIPEQETLRKIFALLVSEDLAQE